MKKIPVAPALLALMTLTAFLAPTFISADATDSDLSRRFLSPSELHWFGTDELGRDFLARLLLGAQTSLAVAALTAAVAAVAGTLIGILAGWSGNRVDALLMRLTDLVIALPVLPLLIVLAATDIGKSGQDLARIVIILAVFSWPAVARLARARVLALKKQDFITAARALGLSDTLILIRHVLPNIGEPVTVAVCLCAGNVILAESVLSFLGLGLPPTQASLGGMLAGAQDAVWNHPFTAIAPGLAIFMIVMALNLTGDYFYSTKSNN